MVTLLVPVLRMWMSPGLFAMALGTLVFAIGMLYLLLFGIVVYCLMLLCSGLGRFWLLRAGLQYFVVTAAMPPTTPQKKGTKRELGADDGSPSPAASSPGGLGGGVALNCGKCGEDTTLAASQPSGTKNPLKRSCNACVATDRWLNRWAEKDKKAEKEGGVLAEDSASHTKKRLKTMGSGQRQVFNKNEKEKRMHDDRNQKRTFCDTKATVEQTRVNAQYLDEVDDYITFEDWAMREIILGRVKDLKAAELA